MINTIKNLVFRREVLSLLITAVIVISIFFISSPTATSNVVIRLSSTTGVHLGYAYAITDVITDEGIFTEDVTGMSEDGKVTITIDEGTKGVTAEGEPLSEITIAEIAEPPPSPVETSIIGLTYDLGPDDAIFDPPITITFTYDPDQIPEGVSEEDLVIAIWDEAAGEWIELEGCTVDPVTHTIMAPVSHFTAFTIIAPAAPLPEEEIAPTNWGLIGGIIAGVVVIIVLLQYFLWWRPRMA